MIGYIARRVKRKIVLRTPIDAMMDMDKARDVIQEIIPEDADAASGDGSDGDAIRRHVRRTLCRVGARRVCAPCSLSCRVRA